MIKESKKNDISLFKIIKTLVPIAFAAVPVAWIAGIIISVLHGVSWGVNTLMTQKFFDSVTALASKDGLLSKAVLMALLLALALVASQVLNGIMNFGWNELSKKVVGCIAKRVNKKSGNIDPIAFEDPKVLDDINKAHEGVDNGMGIIMVLFSIFTFYLPYFLFMGIYLYKLKPILAISIVLIFIPVALTQFIRIKVFSNLEDEAAPIRREYEYYEKCIVDREYYKETRILGAFGYFRNLYKTSLSLLNKKVWKAERKTGLIELGMAGITLIGYLGVLYLLFISLMEGSISVGAFGAVFASVDLMIGVMDEIIRRHIGELTKNIGTVRNLVRFLELPERKGRDIEIEGIPDININNVSFAYPGADKNSLENINLEMKAGETIAIVGENGAGKTTLVKLITGLYLPNEGSVKVGGVDTKDISPKALYKNISAVFQKYQRYKMTLEDNISISDLEVSNKKYNKKRPLSKNKIRLEEAIEKADLEVDEEKFPQSYDTMLSREFEGIDLSGGQWQRVAIARGFYKAHNMIILDEPTAAIDPVEENKIYTKFKEMANGNTAIVVTHRLGSAKIADRIIVMDNGQIVEYGTHEELMCNKGKYEEMYNAQSKWYVDVGVN